MMFFFHDKTILSSLKIIILTECTKKEKNSKVEIIAWSLNDKEKKAPKKGSKVKEQSCGFQQK